MDTAITKECYGRATFAFELKLHKTVLATYILDTKCNSILHGLTSK